MMIWWVDVERGHKENMFSQYGCGVFWFEGTLLAVGMEEPETIDFGVQTTHKCQCV